MKWRYRETAISGVVCYCVYLFLVCGRSNTDDHVVDIVDMLRRLRKLTYQKHDHHDDQHDSDAVLVTWWTVGGRLFFVSGADGRKQRTGSRGAAAAVARNRKQLGTRGRRRHHLCKLNKTRSVTSVLSRPLSNHWPLNIQLKWQPEIAQSVD